MFSVFDDFGTVQLFWVLFKCTIQVLFILLLFWAVCSLSFASIASLRHMGYFSSFANLGKSNACFISCSSRWVIDSRATDYMIGNPNLFSIF